MAFKQGGDRGRKKYQWGLLRLEVPVKTKASLPFGEICDIFTQKTSKSCFDDRMSWVGSGVKRSTKKGSRTFSILFLLVCKPGVTNIAQRERERETDRQTDGRRRRQRQRQTETADRQRQRQKQKQKQRQTDRDRNTEERETQRNRKKDRERERERQSLNKT